MQYNLDKSIVELKHIGIMENEIKTKKCSKCCNDKPLNEFGKRGGIKRGDEIRPSCKICDNKRKREKYLKTHPIELIPDAYKKCGKCKEVKTNCDFGNDINRKSGLKSYCKLCRNNEYDKIKRKYYINNWTNEYNKKNPHKMVWRNVLKHSLERLGQSKEGQTIILLGYSALDLRNHITALFTEGMNWDNYGDWHVDHIKGVINFDKTTHPSIVNALSNIRPLWATTREINGVIYEGNLNRNKYN